MYAVIRTGGKQYRVAEGARLKVERLDAEEGAKVTFDEVLMVGNGDDVKVGAPLVKGGKVTATVLSQGKAKIWLPPTNSFVDASQIFADQGANLLEFHGYRLHREARMMPGTPRQINHFGRCGEDSQKPR